MTQSVTINLKDVTGAVSGETGFRIQLLDKRNRKPGFVILNDQINVPDPVESMTDEHGVKTVNLGSNSNSQPPSFYRITVDDFSGHLDFSVGDVDANLVNLLI